MHTSKNLVCRAILAVGLFLATQARAETPSARLLLGSQGGEVRLIWQPDNWPSDLQGYDLKRRAMKGEWVQLGTTFKPTSPGVKASLTPEKIYEFNSHLLIAFSIPLGSGFGYVDESVADAAGSDFDYAIFPVVRGRTSKQPVATAFWHRDEDVDLDVGLRPNENAWNQDFHEAAFALDMEKMYAKSLQYGFIEEREDRPSKTDVMMTTASPIKHDQRFVCYRPDKPYPAKVLLVIGDKFGFRSTSSMEVPKDTGPRKSGYAVPSLCAGPAVVTDLPPSPRLPPPPPPPAPRR